MKKILVVGGAGYIGSHMVDFLVQQNFEPVVLDNLSTGHRDAILKGEFIQGDLADRELLDKIFTQYQFDAVMHFASFIEVGESVQNPAKYYHNNVCNTLNLLNAMVKHGVNYFIFSSTAAVYGAPVYTPIDVGHPKQPINPYGKSKLMVEQILDDYDHAYGLKSICLRYFNAAGADPKGRLGERHDPESHLIPLILQAANGRRACIKVFGRDYDTPDGTCVRDYIHVVDLCQAHLLGLDFLVRTNLSRKYNLGNGQGFSVQEVIDSAKRVTQKEINVVEAERRPGDPPILIADATAAQADLNWKPQYPDLDTIIKHAWQWEMR